MRALQSTRLLALGIGLVAAGCGTPPTDDTSDGEEPPPEAAPETPDEADPQQVTVYSFALQLAHTGAAFPTVDAVQLWVDGEPIEELWGHLGWAEPFEPAPAAVVPITILEPPAGPGGVTVPAGEVIVRGDARVFEATFGIRLLGADGATIDETLVTASEGAPGRGTWEHVFDIRDPGRYTVEVEEDDPSHGEGRPPSVLRRDIEVR